MPLPLAAQVFLPSIYTQRKKNQCAAKGKGISNSIESDSIAIKTFGLEKRRYQVWKREQLY